MNIHEAKTHLSKLIERVMNGEEVVIAKAGKPMVRLVPIQAKSRRTGFGTLKGGIRISDDFDAPLPDEVLRAFGVTR